MIRSLVLLGFFILASFGAVAQTPNIVFCQPYNTSPGAFPCPAPPSTMSGTTVAVTNTFQVALVAASTLTQPRTACLIQFDPAATSGHYLYVFFKKSGATATRAASFKLAPGDTINCKNEGGQTLQEEVDVTGTSGDSFSAVVQ